LVALLCAGVLVIPKTVAQDDGTFGMNMGAQAYQVVCWYETLKQFPRTNSTGFMDCTGGGTGFAMMAPSMGDQTAQIQFFGSSMVSDAMPILPPEYSNCNQYLNDYQSQFPVDEGDAINDNHHGPYPFQGYSYCMMNTLRRKFGDQAIQQVKDEKTHSTKPWMQSIFDRDNEWRRRHGVPGFELNNELSKRAQEWADTIAARCREGHSSEDAPFRQWRGDLTGESYMAFSGNTDTTSVADAAYISTDGWYEEIQMYPYPQGYQGNEEDPLFEKIGHFTQTVWSDTKYVGYGYAYNPNCDQCNWYIVARYFPIGNIEGQFPNYVFPPKM